MSKKRLTVAQELLRRQGKVRVGYWCTGQPLSMEKRFFAKLHMEQSGCWTWLGSQMEHFGMAYGRFWDGSNVVGAHRFAYEYFKRTKLDKSMEVDHLCRNSLCVNPDHLEAVSHRENMLRGNSPVANKARQTHCKYGHPLSGDNLVLVGTGRKCRTCIRRMNRKSYAKKASNRCPRIA
jgi:hypothetical protein